MTRAELKSQAKEQIKGKLLTLFLMGLIVGVILGVCAIIPAIGTIASLFVAPAFSLSFCMIYLTLTRREEIAIENVFLGFGNIIKAALLNFVVGIFTFLWSLLLVIPGIIKGISYSMATYILAENPEISTMDAISKSQEMMNGHKWEYFVLQLSFIGWYLVGSLTLGIAYIYVIPYVNATNANFYNSIKDNV